MGARIGRFHVMGLVELDETIQRFGLRTRMKAAGVAEHQHLVGAAPAESTECTRGAR
jgi:hypothetical protein